MNVEINHLQQQWTHWVDNYTDQRFGQYYCNRFLPKGYVWPKLFYATSKEAYTMLYDVSRGAKKSEEIDVSIMR